MEDEIEYIDEHYSLAKKKLSNLYQKLLPQIMGENEDIYGYQFAGAGIGYSADPEEKNVNTIKVDFTILVEEGKSIPEYLTNLFALKSLKYKIESKKVKDGIYPTPAYNFTIQIKKNKK